MTLEYDVEIQGLDGLIQRLGAFAAAADEYLSEAMSQSLDVIDVAVRPFVPVWRGQLLNSLGSQITREGAGSIVGRFGSSISGVYPIVMELGRTPGAKPPPVAAIRPWVEDKIGDGRLAFVIARSIGRKGIKPHLYMRRGLERARSAVDGFFIRAVERIAQHITGR